MNVGQEGDTRKYLKLRHSDHYQLKPAVQAEKKEPKRLPKCKCCKQPIVGLNLNGYDLRCFTEPL